MNRRKFLAGAAVAPATVAVPALAAPEDPIIGKIKRYEALKAQWCAENDDKADVDPLWDEWTALESEISTQPAISLEGLRLQTEFVRQRVGEDFRGGLTGPLTEPWQMVMETLSQALNDVVFSGVSA